MNKTEIQNIFMGYAFCQSYQNKMFLGFFLFHFLGNTPRSNDILYGVEFSFILSIISNYQWPFV